MNNYTLYVFLFVISMSGSAFAEDKVTQVSFITSNGKIESILRKELRVDTKLTFAHIDKTIDPSHKKMTYGGVNLEKLLKSKFNTISDSDTVTFVSSDTYVASMPFHDIVASKAMIGLEADGIPTSWKKGTPGLLFPPSTNNLGYDSDTSWWAWWVSGVIQGEPKLDLLLNEKPLDTKICTKKFTRILPYPRGVSFRNI